MDKIIFSKNRPAQLDLLLRSMKLFAPGFEGLGLNVVLFKSDPEYEHGYNIVSSLHPGACFLKEFIFEEDVKKLMSSIKSDKMCFFVDDDVFVRPLSDDFEEYVWGNSVFSLRLHPEMDYCYTMNKPMTPIRSTAWLSDQGDLDFGYPFSLDGHIFNTKFIKDKIGGLRFNNPNTLEATLANTKQVIGMSCLAENVIINNPANRVQSQYPNRAGDYSVEAMNYEWIHGNMISIDPYLYRSYNSPHCEIPIIFIKDHRR